MPAVSDTATTKKTVQSWPAEQLLFMSLWLLVWGLGVLVEYTNHASVWFPAAGLTCAALMVGGLRLVPGLLAAAVIATFITVQQYQLPLSLGAQLNAGLLYGLAHILPYWLAVVLLKQLSKRSDYHLPLFVVTFLLIAALFSLLTTACVLFVLVISGMMPLSDVASTWLPFWVGDFAGVVVIAPMFTSLLPRLMQNPSFDIRKAIGVQPLRPSAEYKYKLTLIVIMLSLSLVLAWYSRAPESAFAVFFLIVPHMWIACTESPFVTTVTLALTSFLIALLVNALGLMSHVMVYQFAISTIAANALFGIAVPALTDANRLLKQQAQTDELTKVASRNYVLARSAREIDLAHLRQEPLCLMVFDIDNFKKINDLYGHAAGDTVLQFACAQAQKVLRPTDLIGRYGGDEFIVLLPALQIEDAVFVGTRIKDRLKHFSDLPELRLTASFGVAQLLAEDNFSSLFERADLALYRAKQQGRDQVAS